MNRLVSHHRSNSHNHGNSLCNNCGKQGHLLHQCKLPITSYGIILFRKGQSPFDIQYLMLNRKDSFGYIDFIRGKYSTNNLTQIQNMINEMSLLEKHKILNESFTHLWKLMWGDVVNVQKYKAEEMSSFRKFEQLKSGIVINDVNINLHTLVENSTTAWVDTEWEFPKGRRNHQEKDLDCALREFEEETGIPGNHIIIVENIMPFEEVFIGTNFKSYKHKYFLAYLKENKTNITLQNFQESEVNKLDWKTVEQCLESIRPYNLEKKELIININNVLQQYRLYS